jgi:hypothetical protein
MKSIKTHKPNLIKGGLAQLARAPALHAGGRRFDSDILHLNISGYLKTKKNKKKTTEIQQYLQKGMGKKGSTPFISHLVQ